MTHHRKHPSTPPPKDKPVPEPVDLASESVAGEEDPGAALDELLSPAPTPDTLKPPPSR